MDLPSGLWRALDLILAAGVGGLIGILATAPGRW
jgi:hypothetical protein